MELSGRLQAVIGLLEPAVLVADVGCDHGYVSIALIRRGLAQGVVAMDVNPGPLARAKAHVEQAGLLTRIDLRRSDGLSALSVGEADAMILAGMGGRLMIRILEQGMEQVRAMKQCILAPQSDVSLLRCFLRGQGLRIGKEDMVKEDGKYYQMMRVVPGGGSSGSMEDVTRMQDQYGPCLLTDRHPVLLDFLRKEQVQCQSLLEALQNNTGENALARSREIRCRLQMIDHFLEQKGRY